MASYRVTGDTVTNPSSSTVATTTGGGATHVRVVATAGTVTGTVNDTNGAQLGEFYLHAAGDEITIRKDPTDTITSATSVAHPVSVGG